MSVNCKLEVGQRFSELKERFGEDIDMLMDEIQTIRDDMIEKGSFSANTFQDKVKQLFSSLKEDNIANMHYQAVQAQRQIQNIKKIKDPAFKNLSEGLESLYIKSTKNVEGASMSVETEMNRMTFEGGNYLEQNLSSADYALARSRTYEKEIIEYLASGMKTDVPAPIKRVADAIKKMNDLSHEYKRQAGMDVQYREDYAFNQRDLLNAREMQKMGKEQWLAITRESLDYEKTFPLMPEKKTVKVKGKEVVINAREEYLGEIFDQITKRADDLEAVDMDNLRDVLSKKGIDIKKGMVRKHMQPRKLIYKPEALGDLFKKMSPDRNILESSWSNFQRTARDVAKYNILGPDGDSAVRNIITSLTRDLQKQRASLDAKIREEVDPTAKKTLNDQLEKLEKEIETLSKPRSSFFLSLANIQDEINGMTNQIDPKGEGLAAFMGNFRHLEIMSKLGGSTISALSDIPTAFHVLNMATGNNYFEMAGKMAQEMVTAIDPKYQRQMAETFNIAIEGMLNSEMQLMQAGGFQGSMVKLGQLYNKVNPIAQQGRFHRIAATTVLARELSNASKKPFKDLASDMQMFLKRAGIDETDWELAKNMIGKDSKGREMFIPRMASFIDEVEVQKVLAKKQSREGLLQGQDNVENYTNTLYRKFNNAFQDFSHNAAPQPGVRERAILYQGTKKGSIPGEAFRMVGMLKSFPVKMAAIMSQTWNARNTKMGKAQVMSQYLIGLTTFGYLSNSLSSLTRGETPPDPTNIKTLRDAFLKGGAAGLGGDFLLQESASGRSSVLAFLGPQFSTISDAKDILGAMVSGDIGEKEARTLFRYVPGNNLFYLRAGLTYTMGEEYKKFMSPNYKNAQRRRLRESEGMLWRQKKLYD